MSQQNYSPVNIYPSIPPSADILDGNATNSAGTIITIPAGRTWMGSVTVTACLGSGASPVNQTAQAVTPTGATPASATLCQVVLNAPTSTSTSAPTASVFGVATTPNVIVMAGTSATTIALTAGAAIQSINGIAVGMLL